MSVFGRQITALTSAIALMLVLPGLTRDSYAQQFYTSDPVWSTSSPHNTTRAVVFGDVDGDGDLDVVFANDGERNTLYLNEGGVFSTAPDWTSGDSSSTFSVALGDVDGDGYLDLVCGNIGESNALYLNTRNGAFSDSSQWFPTNPIDRTFSVALGDIDDDGDLDLVCGNDGQRNTLYLNQGGTFSDQPDWSSGDSSSTRGVALGDIDGDGYLDLVCGNDGQRNALYLNDRNGAFSSSSQWFPTNPIDRTFSVALGDVDGDGLFDLVCGNVNDSNTLYLNTGSALDTVPGTWSSSQHNVTASVTLGDVDTDGDLDLVCGNVQQGNTLYVNNGGTFSVTPDWLSGPTNNTFGIALGDVDGDGDLDAVCGNEGQINTLYTMSGRVMETTPAWLSDPSSSTFGVALGDVDRDGDLDAVFGNGGFKNESNTLYLNQDGVLSSTPNLSWPPDTSSTIGVVLGDVDGNGFLDLVCANAGTGGGQRNTLYLNSGGVFSTTPDWSSDSASRHQTFGVALGDIDGDGDLDLVCGNGGIGGAVNTLFDNVGGVFSTTPIWSSGLANSTVGVVLGDVDGDGDLDLVCGNNEENNTLYLNEGGVLGTLPTWSSGPANNTFGVTLGDVDADGDLDLVCANGGSVDQSNTLYLNEGGVFSTTPDWTSDVDGSSTFSVALGDVDGDGDLDLACGNGGTNAQANTLYLNEGGETVFADAPRWLSKPARSFSVVLGDIDGDGDLDLLSCSEAQQNELYLGARNPLFKGTPTAPANHLPNNGAFLLSVQLSEPDTFDNIVKVAFDAIDVEDDEVYILPEYQYEGDPTWQSVVANAQTERVGPFSASADGTRGSFDWDVSSLAFDARNAILRLRTTSNPRRVALIQRNDSYSKHVGVVTPARAEITTSAASVVFPTVKAGDTTFVDFVIENTGSRMLIVGPITLPRVSEIELDRATPFNLDPGERDTLRFVHRPLVVFEISDPIVIESNDPFRGELSIPVITDILRISTSPIPNLGTHFEEARDIAVQAFLLVGASFIEGTLHYRRGGETNYQQAVLTKPSPEQPPGAVIPDSIVGPRGVEYWIEVKTLTNARVDSLTDPPVSPDHFPFSIPVTVGALEFPYVLPVERYRMFSVPLDVGSILGTLDEFAGQDNTVWRMFGHYDRDSNDPEANYYLEVPNGFSEFELGRAYWIITRSSGVRISTHPSNGLTTPTDSAFKKPLKADSWSMVANPFVFPVAWDSVMVDSLTMAQARAAGDIGELRDAAGRTRSVLEPFEGYWVRNLDSVEIVLSIPPKESHAPGSFVSRATEKDEPAAEWQLKIEASCLRTGDYHNYAGVKPGASSFFDRHDRFKVPMRPGRSISLYFAHFDWEVHPGEYSADYRGEHEASEVKESQWIQSEKTIRGHRWCFDVAKSFSDGTAGDEVALSFSGIDDVPAETRIVLVDRKLGHSIDIREADRYTFFQGKREIVTRQEDARFVLLVGSDDFVDLQGNELPRRPTRTVLHQNYPNPFNPSTIIGYELAHAGHVVLRIYDVRGALVKVLEDRDREPGRYEAGWSGENERGEKVSSGVYFYKLVSGDFTQTKKTILLK